MGELRLRGGERRALFSCFYGVPKDATIIILVLESFNGVVLH